MLQVTEMQSAMSELKLESPPSRLWYGVEFLDRATHGILESDLILLGARSGAGKTEIASIIAQGNAKVGKKVVYYALEADRNEIHSRMLYREVADLYYSKPGYKEPISYPEFRLGELNIRLREEKKQAVATLKRTLAGLDIIYKRENDITSDDIAIDVAFRHKHTDLFILDHIHYVDSKGDENENKALKQLTKDIRTLALVYKTPIICIAHLRKKDRNNKDIVPGMDEFHGSSDLAKIATKIITLAPYSDGSLEPHRHATLIRICKNRLDGSVTNYVAKMIYNTALNCYEEKFELAHIFDCNEEFVGLAEANKVPRWAEKLTGLEIKHVSNNGGTNLRTYPKGPKSVSKYGSGETQQSLADSVEF